MRLRRLAQTGVAELVFRGRQEAVKWWGRIGLVAVRDGGLGPLARLVAPGPLREQIEARIRHGDSGGAARILLDRFRETCAERFFEGTVSCEQTATLVSERVPGYRDRTIRSADAICRGRFDLLGYRGLVFGDPVDWHLDPVSGRRAPLVHWSRLDPLDAATVGDSKVIWELNRHQWLVRLGVAYRLTTNEAYAEAFARYVRDWMLANPYGMGINWASSLEVALRLVSWCWALALFRDSRALSPELFVDMLGAIWAHAEHVKNHLSYYFSPNTHLTGEALGLFYAGIVFPELRRARRWSALGATILAKQSERQILSDGVHFEQATAYESYTLETYLHFLILAARNGTTVPPEVAERIQRMLDFLLAIRRPDGSMPQIGDADGGSLLPLADRAPEDFRGLFATAGAWCRRPDAVWAAGAAAPETFWLLGTAGLSLFEALRPASPPAASSRLFAEGGYAVMRSGPEPHAHHLIFDVGPLGCPVSGGHGHADLLGLQCSVFGEPYLVDPGTYCYATQPEWRSFFRSTAAHSTVVVDGIGQAAPAGPFKWEDRPRARVRRWLSTEAFDFADADHDAYRRLPDPVMHRRRVLFVKPRYWVVVDDLEGAAEHRLDLRFQFAPMSVTVDAALWARAVGSAGHALLIRPFATVPLKAEIIEGEIAPIQGWVSSNYGQRRPAPVLTYTTVTHLPLRIVTLLLPEGDASVSLPSVSALADDGTGPVGLVFEGGREWIRFGDPEGVTVR